MDAKKIADAFKPLVEHCNRTSFRRDVKKAVDRFLGWKLPLDFSPDAGISFTPEYNVEWNAKQGLPPARHEPIGTNLFNADQAEAMFKYCLEGTGYVAYDYTEPAPQGTDEQTSGELASGECLPVGAAPLPDDVAKMVERLRNDHDRNYEDEAADMLERQQHRIKELEAQREGFTLMPNDPTDEIIDAMRKQIAEHGTAGDAASKIRVGSSAGRRNDGFSVLRAPTFEEGTEMRTECCGVMRQGQCSDCPTTAPTRPPALPPHQLGWMCPACGRGNAPTTATCPCQGWRNDGGQEQERERVEAESQAHMLHDCDVIVQRLMGG